MATLHALQMRYENILRIDADDISETDAAFLGALAANVDAGQIGFQAAVDQIVDRAAATTSVATLAYQFFTDAAPRAEGLDYLVSPSGPNPNNLNSAYYQSFSIENRYINFAVNLGAGGAGAEDFADAYGGLSASQTVAKAYLEIFGVAAGAEKVDALINGLVPDGQGGQFTRLEYFATYGGDGVNGIGTKAALVGWLLSEAAKAGLGPYVAANEAFLQDLSGDGHAAFEQNILEVYGPEGAPAAGTTITVTAGQSVSPTAADAALRSTANDDVVQGAGGLDAVQSVLTGGGRDTVTFAGASAGLIDTGAGSDTITVGVLPKSVDVLGGAENGVIRAGAGDDVITVTQRMEFGSTIDGGAGEDTAIIALNEPDVTSAELKILGIEHLVISSAQGYGRTLDVRGATDLRDVTIEADEGFTLQNVADGVAVGLRGVEGGSVTVAYQTTMIITGPTSSTIGAGFGEIHLDGVTTPSDPDAAPTELILANLNGALYLHVDSDSVLSRIAASDQSGAVGGIEKVVVSGPGALTAALTSGTLTLDASDAAEVHITRFGSSSVATSATLSAGDDTIAADLLRSVNAGVATYTLGEGADTFSLYQDGFNAPRFGNLHVTGPTVDGYASITDFEKGVDHVVLGPEIAALNTGLTEFVGDAASLEAALVNVSSHLAANATGVFEYDGDTYIYRQDATVGVNTGDGLIQLVGVVELTAGTGAGPFDVHYG